MELLFWGSAIVVGYVYAGYPLLLAVWARLAARPPRIGRGEDRVWPSISIVVAARNEAGRLPARVRNLIDLPYPGRREILVVSDGSSDQPAVALAPFGEAVRLLELPPGGKPQALNAGVAEATGEILVFADARQTFSPDTLTALARNFDDPQVGGVTGELVLDAEAGGECDSTIGDGVGLYWRYEKWLRRHESAVWSTLGATGAIYALRRSAWRPLPADTLLDDVLAPMRVVLGGSRIVFEEGARAYDRTAPDAAAEGRRKTRTLAGNYQILWQEPRLLVPIVNPVWLQYLSHKVGRLLVPWALTGAFLASAMLAVASWWYAAAFGLQAAFYGLALLGAWFEARDRAERPAFGTTPAALQRGRTPASLQREEYGK
jgi:poly-beta-1,6-N-acetyl-D-glucosamine synthase